MTVGEILKYLEKIMPNNLAYDWDNVGLLIGEESNDVNKILVCLDVSNEAVEKAVNEGVDLIIAHHPIIFSPIKRITSNSVLGRKIIKLLKNNIAVISMHTNYDTAKTCMADICANILELKDIKTFCDDRLLDDASLGIGKYGKLGSEVTVKTLARLVKDKFDLFTVVIHGDEKKLVKNVAISPGSGKGMYKYAKKKGVEVLITGDITHHEALDALDEDMIIIDAGHYGLEKVFIPDIIKKLNNSFENLTIVDYYESNIFKYMV